MYQFQIGLKLVVFYKAECIHKHNVIFNKTVTKLVIILIKYLFQYLNPTSYLKSFEAYFQETILCLETLCLLFASFQPKTFHYIFQN